VGLHTRMYVSLLWHLGMGQTQTVCMLPVNNGRRGRDDYYFKILIVSPNICNKMLCLSGSCGIRGLWGKILPVCWFLRHWLFGWITILRGCTYTCHL
jgi:hypothetical protein